MPSTITYLWENLAWNEKSADIGGDGEVTIRRHVRREDGAAWNFSYDTSQAETEGAIPRRGSKLFSSGTGLLWQQYLRFRGYTMDVLPNKSGAMFTLSYSTRYVLAYIEPVSYFIPNSIEYQSVSRSTRVYRTGWTVNPPAASDVSAEIGGNAVQGVGESMAWPVRQNRIRIRLENDAFVVPISTAASNLTVYQNLTNSAAFLGYAANTLVCEGVTLNPIRHEFYEITFDFLFDPWFHHEQVPDLAPDGRPDRTASGPKTVKWKRLPRSSADFNNIYANAMQKTMNQTGYPII